MTASTSLVGCGRTVLPAAVSALVLLVAAGAMPALPALALVCGVGASAVLLRFGVGELLASRALHGARSPTAAEAAVLAPAITRVCAAGLGPPLVRVAVQPQGHGLVAFPCGGATVVVPRALVVAVHSGRVSSEQAAASLTHAAAICSAGLTRGQLASLVWCLPWVAVEAVVAGVGRSMAGVALLRLAWRARVVVAAIAVAQNAAGGHPWMAAALVALIGATYAHPALNRLWHRRLARVGDDALADHGLGGHYVALLAISGYRVDLERHARLTRPQVRDRPRRRRALPDLSGLAPGLTGVGRRVAVMRTRPVHLPELAIERTDVGRTSPLVDDANIRAWIRGTPRADPRPSWRTATATPGPHHYRRRRLAGHPSPASPTNR